MSDSGSWQLAADAFLAGKNSKGKYPRTVFGMYRIVEGRKEDGTLNGSENLEYHTSDGKKDVVAVRTANGTFCNSSILPNVGRRMTWGYANHNRKETPIQAYMRTKGSRMIPMYQLIQNGFSLDTIKVVQQGEAETVTVKGEEFYNYSTNKQETKPDEVRHFTGAALIETKDKDGKAFQFLFDIDRNEIQHKRFNPFFVQLVKPCKTIEQAYASLKPKKVVDAEKKGLKVLRQGEWFFIPTNYNPERNSVKDPKKLPLVDKLLMMAQHWGHDTYFTNKQWETLQKKKTKLEGSRINSAQLRAGQNRPNTVEKGVTLKEITYVKGKVQHTGREHEDLVLNGWYIAVPNTSVKSWQLDGNID